MISARRAVPGDAEELIRLRAIMLAELANDGGSADGRPNDGGSGDGRSNDGGSGDGRPPDYGGSGDERWREVATVGLRAKLAETAPATAAFVVDRTDRHGALAACAVGVIDQRLGGPANPLGRTGYILNVVTEPDQRRQGYSRACLTALIGWFREQGIRAVDLRTSEEGESLYRELGFRRASHPGMRLRLGENVS